MFDVKYSYNGKIHFILENVSRKAARRELRSHVLDVYKHQTCVCMNMVNQDYIRFTTATTVPNQVEAIFVAQS